MVQVESALPELLGDTLVPEIGLEDLRGLVALQVHSVAGSRPRNTSALLGPLQGEILHHQAHAFLGLYTLWGSVAGAQEAPHSGAARSLV